MISIALEVVVDDGSKAPKPPNETTVWTPDHVRSDASKVAGNNWTVITFGSARML